MSTAVYESAAPLQPTRAEFRELDEGFRTALTYCASVDSRHVVVIPLVCIVYLHKVDGSAWHIPVPTPPTGFEHIPEKVPKLQ